MCVVISVDVICLGVIPAPWLYLLGSLAVWGQVGWNLTPLGPLLLLPTLIYIDGKSIRPLPSQPLSPLAAHWYVMSRDILDDYAKHFELDVVMI